MKINYLINELINYAKEKNIIDEYNLEYCTNVIIDFLNLTYFEKEDTKPRHIDNILDDIANYAYENKIISGNDVQSFDNFKAKLMDCLMDQPALVQKKFEDEFNKSSSSATDYLYNLSKDSNYIQTTRISKNISYTYKSIYGELMITINLSKPEKDPKLITLALKNSSEKKYPKCQLCLENVGYRGHMAYDGRSNLRAVKINLDNEDWYFQFSPYSYFNEHAIIFNKKHTPMIINKSTFKKLTDFIDQFPDYFIGSNAGLPIVGGSILNHEHYQGGKFHFPIETAKSKFVKEINNVRVYKVNWPLSTVRLKSNNKENIIDVCNLVLNKWQSYANEEINLFNSRDDLHHTITPILRYENGEYVFDLILRSNYVTKEHPLGFFHPHENLHHVKKENIGLIEAIGLAILPARLRNASEKISRYLDGEKELIDDESLKVHVQWIKEIEKTFKGGNSYNYVLDEIGKVFMHVLEDAGVFKMDQKGQYYYQQFIESL